MARAWSYYHELRGRPGHCDRCGVRTVWGATRCFACLIGRGGAGDDNTLDAFTEQARALDLDAPLDGSADGDETPYGDDRLATYPQLPAFRPVQLPSLPAVPPASTGQGAPLFEALDGGAADALVRSLRQQEDEAIWSRTAGDKPAFALDSRCFVCCLIMTEYAASVVVIRPTMAGYRCARHSGSWRDFPQPEEGRTA